MTVEVGWRAGVPRLVCDDGQLVDLQTLEHQNADGERLTSGIA